MQFEVVKKHNLFNKDGDMIAGGWSRQPNFVFDKDYCKVSRLKLQERDCYFVENNKMGLYLSIAQYGLSAIISAALADYSNGTINSCTVTKFFAAGRVSLPASSLNGDVTYADNRVGINFSNTSVKRYIKCDFVDFAEEKNLYVNLCLDTTTDESLNVAIPFTKNKKCFFSKRFLPSMKATGVIRFGGIEFDLNKQPANAYLDWSRYALNTKSFYHALYCTSKIKDKDFALCLAGGIGNVSKGNENCFFYDGKIYKLANIRATGSENNPDKPWRFESKNSIIEITFKPLIKNGRLFSTQCDKRNLIFGTISGSINYPNSQPIIIEKLPANLQFVLI